MSKDLTFSLRKTLRCILSEKNRPTYTEKYKVRDRNLPVTPNLTINPSPYSLELQNTIESNVPCTEIVSTDLLPPVQFNLSPAAWKWVSRGLYTKLIGQAIGWIGVVSLFAMDLWPLRIVSVPIGLVFIGISLDAIGRLACLSGARKSPHKTYLLSSVQIQLIAVAIVVFIVIEELWPFIVLPVLFQFLAANYFTRFLRQLAQFFEMPELVALGTNLKKSLDKFAISIVPLVGWLAIGLVIVFIGGCLFLYLAWVAWGVGVILLIFSSLPFLYLLLALGCLIQVRYSILVYRLAKRTAQEAQYAEIVE